MPNDAQPGERTTETGRSAGPPARRPRASSIGPRHGRIEGCRRGPSYAVPAASRSGRSFVGGRAGEQHDPGGPPGGRGERGVVEPLVRASRHQHHGARQRLEGRRRGVRHGRGRVVVIPDAARLVEQLEPVLHAGELSEGAGDHLGLHAVARQRETRGEQVHPVVRTREARAGEDGARGACRAPRAAGLRRRSSHAPSRPSGSGAAEYQDSPGPRLVRESRLPGVVAVEHRVLVRAPARGRSPSCPRRTRPCRGSGRGGRAAAPSARTRRGRSTPRPARSPSCHDESSSTTGSTGPERVDEVQGRHRDVAPEAGARGDPSEHVVDRRRGRRFALRARDRDHGIADHRQEHRQVGLHGHARGPGRGRGTASRRARRGS